MSEGILVLNAGSSSLKFAVFVVGTPPRPLLRGAIDGLRERPRLLASDARGTVVAQRAWPAGSRLTHDDAIDHVLAWGRQGPLGECRIVAAGHRVVHGGVRFEGPALIDGPTLAAIEALVPLAPLHQPANVAAIRAVTGRAPSLPQVACFDTAFHRTQPREAQAFAIPRALAAQGIRRYGFHGLSYESIAGALPAIDPRAAGGRTVVLHLGNGASMCALRAGRSVATTMGFTALDGLPMGTRSGAIDPGVLLHLLRGGADADSLERLLYRESGLLGVSGVSSDMRTLLASDDPRAAEAIDLFVYRISRELGSLAASLGGLDAVVLTGGIGENSARIRARVLGDAEWLGVRIDTAANAAGGPRLSAADSPVSAWAVPTDEERVVAEQTLRVLGLGGS